MKKFAQIVSLSVVLCLCCCFSTFGSVKAFAINDTYPVYSLSLNKAYSSYGVDFIRGDDGVYWADFNSSSTSSEIYIRLFDDESESDSYLNFPIIKDSYDYYVYASYAQRTTGGSFMPSSIVFSTGDGRTEYSDQILEQNKYINRFIASNADYGIVQTVFFGKLNIYDSSDKYNKYGAIKFKGDTGTFSGRQYFEFAIIMVPKGNAQTYTDIMNTINYQTHVIGEKLDALDQALEEQYQIEDGEDFGFSDIQEQYEEKMGVLTFGTETTLQMLDLFSPSNAGEAYIRVPGWSMDIQGETHEIWKEYTFYFSWIEDWIPRLVRLMRTFNVTMFYIAILVYINKVYERNFLAK